MSYESISLVEMDDFLRQRRFKPVDLYFRRRPVKEWVYERRLPQNANHFVRVYTTIQRYGGKADQSRDVGKDAIRVQVIYRDEKGETLVSMPKRVNRVSTWRDNLDDRLKELAESLPKVKMDRRGEPMTLRKKRGNLFWGSRDYPNYKETQPFRAETVRECRECGKKDGITTIQAGTYCYDCLPINLGAEDNYDATYGKKQAKIRRRLKNKIMKQNIMGTAANKWSARKSQELKRQYEKACEKAGLASYKGSKTAKQDDLSNWSKQKWTTASGKKSSVTGEPYFPEKAVAALKKRGLYAKAKRQKQKANKAKKNARYSDDIREVVGQFRAEDINQNRDNSIINLLLVEWIMKTNETYDSLTISKGLGDYIYDSPYDFVRHMQNQDLISLMPSSRALVPADFLYYLKDKDRDHWANMKSRAISKERYHIVKEKISKDLFWLSDIHKANYEHWLRRSAINYQNI